MEVYWLGVKVEAAEKPAQYKLLEVGSGFK